MIRHDSPCSVSTLVLCHSKVIQRTAPHGLGRLNFMKSHVKTALLSTLSLVILAGCSRLSPDPLTEGEILGRVAQDKTKLFAEQQPVRRAITLHEAMARALKYNLDHRVKQVEEALTFGQMRQSALAMLPTLSSSLGRSHRSEFSSTYSEDLFTRAENLSYSISQEKTRTTADVSFMWSALDFGVSYLTAKQTADQYLISQENRRKAVQDLMRDVRTAYWQAVTAEAVMPRMNGLLDKAYKALDKSQALEKQGQDPEAAMNYQQELLTNIRQLLAMRRDLDMAKYRLASLMNLKPGTPYTLDTNSLARLKAPKVSFDVPYLEELALANRPELREQDYQARIGGQEVRKALVSMLPSLELSYAHSYDGNKYLFKDNWFDAAAQVSYNIMSLVTGPQAARVAKTQIALAQNQRLALGMAVITQVNLALRHYHHLNQEYTVVDQLHGLSKRRSDRAQAAQEAELANEMAAIQSEVASLVSEVQRDMSYAELQDALGMVYHAVGLDPIPDMLLGEQLDTLVAALEEHWSRDQQLLQQAHPTVIIQPQGQPMGPAAALDGPPKSMTLTRRQEEPGMAGS